MAVKNMCKWVHVSVVVVMRFLGLTPQSSSLRELLVSITAQLAVIYNMDPPQAAICKSTVKIANHFGVMLEQISKWHAEKRPLVLILDGLDELDDTDRVFTLFLLPTICLLDGL